jgi:SAM-dependent methyltransferase
VNVNYEYFLSYLIRHAEANPSLCVLDFGCGDALLVKALRDRDIECFGAEIFYGEREHRAPHVPSFLAAGIVRPIPPDGRLPFEDDYFDLIFSNQVFEHVEHLDAVVAELSHILRPTGRMYHHFPSSEVIREGHFGIPLSHWIRSIATRRRYMLALPLLGLGYHKQNSRTRGQRWRPSTAAASPGASGRGDSRARPGDEPAARPMTLCEGHNRTRNWSAASVGHVSPPQPFHVTDNRQVGHHPLPGRELDRHEAKAAEHTLPERYEQVDLVSAINARLPRARKRI